MDPTQQPNQAPQPQQPVSPDYQPAPAPAQPVPISPSLPSSYAEQTPPATYDPNYLDSIAPAPPRAKFLSGSFGKFFYILLGVFVLAVSLIIAFSGKDKTADLQQTTVRVTNFVLLTKTEQTYLKSDKLIKANSSLELVLTGAESKGTDLLGQAGVKKSQYSKTMVRSETKISDDLTSKFEDARLNAVLDRVYASTMAAEVEKLIALFHTMSRESKAKAIRDYANNLVTNLQPLQKTFDGYVDDGN